MHFNLHLLYVQKVVTHVFYCNLLYKMGHYFLDMQYFYYIYICISICISRAYSEKKVNKGVGFFFGWEAKSISASQIGFLMHENDRGHFLTTHEYFVKS